jgi:outer membrane protein assembly factor BamB
VQTDWPQFLRGPEHHGYNATENVLNVSNVAGLQVTGNLLWSAPLGETLATAATANGVVYIGSQGYPNSNLYALNASTGQTLWTANTGYPVETGLAVANGILYATVSDTVFAFGLPPAAPTNRPDPAILKPDPTLVTGQ